jgi:hypothetical protein
MNLQNAIAMLAVGGTRQDDGTVVVGGQRLTDFPREIVVEGAAFDLSEQEEVDPESGYWLAHYFRRDDRTR